MSNSQSSVSVERWDIFEATFSGPQAGNPFEVEFGAVFSHGHREIAVAGFYDGAGHYVVRFMPDTPGEWRYVTTSDVAALAGHASAFQCVAPSAGNHGPVDVSRRFHFAYADGTPYRELGTTCYAWVHQGAALEEQTLETLRTAPFNKMRMCVFPKHYTFNHNEPELYPFEPGADSTPGQWTWDWTRFNPAFFQHLEKRIGQLRDLGIEADLILFHPYDRWGFAAMPPEADDRYLRYVVARLAAYRNIWWSLANEWDLMKTKTLADWERFFHVVQESDPHHHLRSIHNCFVMYDHSLPWVTHQSIQRHDVEQTAVWRRQYGKPVVIDECCYEGNIPNRWGDITAEEMVRRFWEPVARGGYGGHGETYVHPQEILWWSKGGVLHGQSPARLAFLRDVMAAFPAEGLDPLDRIVSHDFPCAGQPGRYYLTYTGVHQPTAVFFALPEGRYRADVLDTWNMTVTPVPGEFSGPSEIPLPGRPYTAVRVVAVE